MSYSMRIHHYFLSVLTLILLIKPAIAVELKQDDSTTTTFSITETTAVESDTLTASLRVEKEDKNQVTAQKSVNEAMNAALEEAKKFPDVEAFTQQYYVYQFDQESNKQKVKMWRAGQGISLVSTKPDSLLRLTERLQESGLLMDGLTYSLSLEKAETTREALLEKGIAKLKDKAERVATLINRKFDHFTLIYINTDNTPPTNSNPAPVMLKGAEANNDTPVAKSGNTDVSITIYGSATLQ